MRVGIFTHYYDSQNYGGNLQAYALARYLQLSGFDAEQVCYARCGRERSLRRCVSNVYHSVSRVLQWVQHPIVMTRLKTRRHAMLQFNHAVIPHSDKVYTDDTVKTAAAAYDALITGSDQVWHPSAVCDAYLLHFPGVSARKLSYAASVAVPSLSDGQKTRYREAFSDFAAISVREREAVDLIGPLSPVPVEWVVDPVFLLPREEWERLAVVYPRTPQSYVFCYFFGDDPAARACAAAYAKAHGLQLVQMPHLLGRCRRCDKGFGDVALYDVSPEMFMALIRDAACVFTDSFHASAFSLIFEKQFFVFERSAKTDMGSRIASLSALFGVEAHYCNTPKKVSADYIKSAPPIQYDASFTAFEELRAASERFLRDNLT